MIWVNFANSLNHLDKNGYEVALWEWIERLINLRRNPNLNPVQQEMVQVIIDFLACQVDQVKMDISKLIQEALHWGFCTAYG